MKTLIDKFKNIHPLAAFAAIGGALFATGGFIHFVNSVPYGLMWAGGGIVFIAAMGAISA